MSLAAQSAAQIALSGGLSLGVPLLIALYEWRSIRRKRNDDDDGRRDPKNPAPIPLKGDAKRLPPCLIPTDQWRAPARERELA